MASPNQAPAELPVSGTECKNHDCTLRRSSRQRPKLFYGSNRTRSLNKQLEDSKPGHVYEIRIKSIRELPVFCTNKQRKPTKPCPNPALTNYTELTVYAKDVPLFRKLCHNNDVDALVETDLISEALKNKKEQLAKDLNTLRLVVRQLNGKSVKIKFIPVDNAFCAEYTGTGTSQHQAQQNDETDGNYQGRDENVLFTKLSPPWFCDSCSSQVDGSLVRGMKLRTYFAHYQHFTEVHGFTANPSRCQYCGCCMQEARLLYHRFTEHGILPPVGILENLMCLECGNVSQNETALRVHKELHRKGHQCSVCQEPFEAIQDLLRHLDHTSHQTEPRRSYTCPFLGCSRVFYRNSLLVIHMRMSHEELALRFDLEGWPPILQHEDKLQLILIEGGVHLRSS